MAKHLHPIQMTFLEALSKVSPSSQAYRLRCLIHIVRNLKEDHTDFVHQIVPEAVLCIKATNEKARNGAYTLLVVIGEALQRWTASDSERTDVVVKDNMKVILAGLAASPTVINCTILAITRIFYEFRDIFPDDLMEMIVTNVCLLLTSQSREVVGASLSFLHVFVTTNDVLKSAQHVEGIVKSMLKMPEDCMRHFRLKTRYLLDRLVRKFGFDLVSSLVPKDDVQMHKRLKNIKKVQVKKRKDKEAAAAAAAADDDDSDDDEEKFKVKARPKTIGDILAESDEEDAGMDENQDAGNRTAAGGKGKRKKAAQSFIATGGEDATGGSNIVDFLDASASQNIMSAPPKKQGGGGGLQPMVDQGKKAKSKKKKTEFPIGPDGRMIIKDLDIDDDDDDDDEEEAAGDEKDDYRMLASDSDDNEEKSQNTFEKLVSTRKRKAGTSVVSGRSGRASSHGCAGPSSMKYRAGGSGIHRPLGEAAAAAKTDYGSEYRAKKGRGDVKVKGRPDPHAYVPLQKSSLNKRKKAKFEGQFKSLVKATKKGAAAGKKGFLANKLKKMSMQG